MSERSNGVFSSPRPTRICACDDPHSITLFLEGQGYILAILAAYMQGRAFLGPKTVGLERRRDGYLLACS